MKRLWNALGKQTKGASFQQKAIQHVEKIEKGEAYVKAPQHEGEKKHFERAQLDETVKKALASRDERLIDSMNKMTIKSSDPPERWTSTKELPTRESELLHKNDPMWEFGFYEPPLDKMPKGKLMFREALEILRARQELDDEGATAKSAQRREQAQEALSAHPATSRINAEQLDLIYKYFRPFERKDTQKVVPKVDLARLQDHLQGRGDEFRLTDGVRDNVRTLLRKNKDAVEDYDKLDAAEKEQLRDAIKQLQAEQQDRLHKRLGEINKMEEAFQQAAKKAMQKQDVDPSDKKQQKN